MRTEHITGGYNACESQLNCEEARLSPKSCCKATCQDGKYEEEQFSHKSKNRVHAYDQEWQYHLAVTELFQTLNFLLSWVLGYPLREPPVQFPPNSHAISTREVRVFVEG